MDIINQIGKACPLPVVEAKKYIRTQPETAFSILVDNEEAIVNLNKLAKDFGYITYLKEENDHYLVTFEVDYANKSQGTDPAPITKNSDNYIAVFDSDKIGDDNSDFGKTLLQGFLYALSENEQVPVAVIMYNKGVYLSAGDNEDILSDLNELQEKGARILSCGLCLDNYKLKSKLKIGEISNMYEIVSLMSKYRVVRP